ncbi:MAG: hypothetical protein OXR66_03965 [Candidatus Woesearchaeota archaeon]|nr:hypothetical protein [Candidatus Woesearchaeota archaeon]
MVVPALEEEIRELTERVPVDVPFRYQLFIGRPHVTIPELLSGKRSYGTEDGVPREIVSPAEVMESHHGQDGAVLEAISIDTGYVVIGHTNSAVELARYENPGVQKLFRSFKMEHGVPREISEDGVFYIDDETFSHIIAGRTDHSMLVDAPSTQMLRRDPYGLVAESVFDFVTYGNQDVQRAYAGKEGRLRVEFDVKEPERRGNKHPLQLLQVAGGAFPRGLFSTEPFGSSKFLLGEAKGEYTVVQK